MAFEQVEGISYPIRIDGPIDAVEKLNKDAERLVGTLKRLNAQVASSLKAASGNSRGSAGNGQSEIARDTAEKRKQIAIDKELSRAEVDRSKLRSGAVQNTRAQLSLEKELARNKIEIFKLESGKLDASRRDLSIRRELQKLEAQRSASIDSVLQTEKAITQSKVRQASIDRQVTNFKDQYLRSSEDVLAIERQIDAAKRKLRLLSSKELQDQKKATREAEKRARVEERIADERARALNLESEAELKNLQDINRRNLEQLTFEKKLARARDLLTQGSSGREAAESVGLTADRLKRAGIDADRLTQILERQPTVLERVRKRFGDLRGTLERVSGASAGLFFTFRRLIGILAVFTIARQLTAGLGRLISETIRFNAELEQTRLGIAAIVVSTGQVFDPLGNQIRNAGDAIKTVLPEARRQLEELRLDALKTSATFQDLSQAFQVAIAPGLQAGLELDQIRKFTVQISQAATAIGLQQNQLAEEIRSILGGTIQIRTTRIAAALGISNEDIRRAKELGVLSEFLQDRFGSFAAAGEESLKNLTTIFTNLKDGILLLLGTGSLEFFDSLKQVLVDITDQVRTINEATGEIELNPNIVAALELFSEGAAKALLSAVKFTEQISSNQLAPVLQVLANSLQLVASSFSGFLSGFLASLSDAAVILQAIGNAISSLSGNDVEEMSENFENIARTLGRILGIVAAVKTAAAALSVTLLAISTVSSVISIIWTRYKAAVTAVRSISISLAATLGTIKGISAAISVIFTAIRAKAIAASVAINIWPVAIAAVIAALVYLYVRLKDIEEQVNVALRLVFGKLAKSAEIAIRTLWFNLKSLFSEGFKFILDSGANLVEGLLNLVGKVSKTARNALKDFKEIRENVDGVFTEDQEKKADEFASKIKQLNDEILDLERNAQTDFAAAENQEKFSDKFKGVLTNGISATKDFLGGFLEVDGAAESLSDRIDNLPTQVSSVSEAARELREEFSKIDDTIRGIEGDIKVAIDQIVAPEFNDLGTTGVRRPFVEIQSRGQIELQEQSRKLAKELSDQEAIKLGLLNQQSALAVEISSLTDQQLNAVQQVEEVSKKQILSDRAIAEAVSSVTLKRIELQKATKEGDDDQISSAQRALDLAESTLRSKQLAGQQARQQSDAVQEQIKAEVEGGERLIDLAINRITLSGRIERSEATISSMAEVRAQLEQRINTLTSRRIALKAQEVRADAAAIKRQRESTVARVESNPFFTDQEKQQQLLEFYSKTIEASEQLKKEAEENLKITDARIKAIFLEAAALEAAGEPISDRLREELKILQAKRDQAEITASQATLDLEVARSAAEELSRVNPNSLIDQYLLAITSYRNRLGTVAQNLADVIASPLEGMHQGLIDGIQRYIYETGDAMDILRGLSQGVFESLSQSLAKFIADWISQRALAFATGQALEKANLAASTANAAATTAAWAPAAATVSAATFGSSAGVGTGILLASIAAAVAAIAAFAGGGYANDQIQGFASGGSPRPEGRKVRDKSGVPKAKDKRDRLLGWFRPFEYILKPEAVRYWGLNVMRKMNDMTLSPLDLMGKQSFKNQIGSRISMAQTQTNLGSALTKTVRGFAAGGPGSDFSASGTFQGPPTSTRVDFSNDTSEKITEFVVVPDLGTAIRLSKQVPNETRIREINKDEIRKSRSA